MDCQPDDKLCKNLEFVLVGAVTIGQNSGTGVPALFEKWKRQPILQCRGSGSGRILRFLARSDPDPE
jgi:hypothetical protein